LFYADLEYVRRSVPIRAVADRLGLRINGKMVHCWRPDNHQHGDRTPSVGLQERRNIAKCFVCDARALSPIDLVMSVLGADLSGALRWIASRWNVPSIQKGKHLDRTQRWPERFRVGTTDSRLDGLIRSFIWASLTPAERSIFPVLNTYADRDGKVTISYRGIMRYAGVRSPTTVATAIKRFQHLRMLSVQTKNGDGFRECNSYRLTLDDTEFQALVSRTVKAQRKAIEEEKMLRAAARKQRRSLLLVNSLSNGCSVVKFHATVSRSVKQRRWDC